MNKYEVIKTIGEGAYGVVLQCRNKETGELVAIKRFKESDEDELVRKTTLREVKILRLLKEETFVVHLLEAFRRKGKLYLVFEYVGCNLLDVLEQHPQGLDMEDVRRMIFTLLLGVRACHSNSVIHRDIKPENLLLHSDNTLRLCDFGFARIYNNTMNDLTDYVATRWYRSPELLLGTTNYGLASDMWAIGCIMAEMIDGQALFPGESELDQIFMIQKLLGNFTPQQQDIFRKNKRFANETLRDISKTETTLERKYGRKANKKAMHFLKSLLVIDPEKRLTVDEAVNHPLFEGMIDTYAPHLRLVTPLIRPSTATRTMQSQPALTGQGYLGTGASSTSTGVSGLPADTPPRPASTSLEPPPPTQQVYAIPGTATLIQNSINNHQPLSSRVSQASSNNSIPPTQQQQQQPRSGAPGSSFLPSRIGSGHRRPPSQQRRDDAGGLGAVGVGGIQTGGDAAGGVAHHGQPSPMGASAQLAFQSAPRQDASAPTAPSRSGLGSASYGNAAAAYGYGAPTSTGAPMPYSTSNINPNLNLGAYSVGPGFRGNLPRLGQTGPAAGQMQPPPTGSNVSGFGRFGSGSGNNLINGGSTPARTEAGGGAAVAQPHGHTGNNFRPPPSQQASRSRFFYS